MDKKAEFVWNRMGTMILVLVLLFTLMIILFFMRGSLDQIWAKVVNMMRFGG